MFIVLFFSKAIALHDDESVCKCLYTSVLTIRELSKCMIGIYRYSMMPYKITKYQIYNIVDRFAQ